MVDASIWSGIDFIRSLIVTNEGLQYVTPQTVWDQARVVAAPTPAPATYNQQPIGYIDSCELKDKGTIFYGWAYDHDGEASVELKIVGSSEKNSGPIKANIAQYRNADINAFVAANRPGSPLRSAYGFSWYVEGIYKGGLYSVGQSTLINVGGGANASLPFNTSSGPPSNGKGYGFPGSAVPIACQVNAPATPAPQNNTNSGSTSPQTSAKTGDKKPVPQTTNLPGGSIVGTPSPTNPANLDKKEVTQKLNAAKAAANQPQNCSVADYKELYSNSSGAKNCKEYPPLVKCETKNKGPNGGLEGIVDPSEYYEFKDNGCVSKATREIVKCIPTHQKSSLGYSTAVGCILNPTTVSAAKLQGGGSIVGAPAPPAGSTTGSPVSKTTITNGDNAAVLTKDFTNVTLDTEISLSANFSPTVVSTYNAVRCNKDVNKSNKKYNYWDHLKACTVSIGNRAEVFKCRQYDLQSPVSFGLKVTGSWKKQNNGTIVFVEKTGTRKCQQI